MSEGRSSLRIRSTVIGESVRISGDLRGRSFEIAADLDSEEISLECDTPVATPAAPAPVTPCKGCGKIGKLIKGAWAWGKTAVGADAADAFAVEDRKTTCEKCPSKCYDFGICRDDFPDRAPEEQGCGCILALKVLLKSEKCPHNHWSE